MPTTVLGLGPGLFVLVLVWSAVGFLCVVLCRARRPLALSAVAAASVLSLLLAAIPHHTGQQLQLPSSSSDADDWPQLTDPLYIWRLVLVTLLLLSSIGGTAAVLALHYSQPILAKPLRRFARH